jgi:YfiH family protein
VTDRDCIRHPLFESIGVVHGFGTRESSAPPEVLRPVQVHGVEVLRIDTDDRISSGIAAEADAIVSRSPGQSIAIATADCLPVLASCESGTAVAAIHAGWRGLAKGVVEAGIEALRSISASGEPIRAVIGPHIGQCCYEIDEPVLEATTLRFGEEAVARASIETTRGHARLSLAALAHSELDRAGVPPDLRDTVAHSCTSCDIRRFHSFRRDGARAGRMVHFIATAHE